MCSNSTVEWASSYAMPPMRFCLITIASADAAAADAAAVAVDGGEGAMKAVMLLFREAA